MSKGDWKIWNFHQKINHTIEYHMFVLRGNLDKIQKNSNFFSGDLSDTVDYY